MSNLRTIWGSNDLYRIVLKLFKKKYCEKCGAKNDFMAGNYRVRRKILTVHHKDNDWRNNNPFNLMTLCTTCHKKEHSVIKTVYTRKVKQTHIKSLSKEWLKLEKKFPELNG